MTLLSKIFDSPNRVIEWNGHSINAFQQILNKFRFNSVTENWPILVNQKKVKIFDGNYVECRFLNDFVSSSLWFLYTWVSFRKRLFGKCIPFVVEFNESIVVIIQCLSQFHSQFVFSLFLVFVVDFTRWKLLFILFHHSNCVQTPLHKFITTIFQIFNMIWFTICFVFCLIWSFYFHFFTLVQIKH